MSRQAPQYPADLRVIMCGLFFALGCITSLNDVIIPKLKALFGLPYVRVMLIEAAFFAGFLLVALPAAWAVRRVGYMRTAVLGLLTLCIGCLLFVPASGSGYFPVFLAALFVLGSGITIVQVMINPLLSILGDPATTMSRLSFSQAFYSLGTTVMPYFGSLLILGGGATIVSPAASAAVLGAFRIMQTRIIEQVYLVIALIVLAMAVVVWQRRHRFLETPPLPAHVTQGFALFRRPNFAFGCASIFAYVGAEIALGSIIVNYLMQPAVMGLSAESAGKHLPMYWGGAMIGRFLGGHFLKNIPQGRVLMIAATIAMGLLVLSAVLAGDASGWALLAVGLCNSVMYPTLFSLACRDLGEHAAEGSGVIVLASVGGGVVPLLTGFTADHLGLKMALGIPVLCYLVVGCFGVCARPARGKRLTFG